jgi:asparagine synthase (glutamine-hydrolysing)
MRADAAEPYDLKLAKMFDEPFASSAALSAAHISELAARHFKVMLSGEGGDELFGGYRWYRNWINWYGDKGKDVPLWTRPRNALRAMLGRTHMPADPLQGYAYLLGAYTRAEMESLFDAELLRQHPCAADASAAYRRIDDPSLRGFDRLQTLDVELFLPAVCLTKMDRASMAHSLEVRVPMLDNSVVNLASRLAVEVRNPDATLKGLLKRVARGKLPQRLLSKRKEGFSTPVRRWFSPAMIVDEIARDAAREDWWRGIFAPSVAHGTARLKGRALWRFWHTWRWVKHARA